MQKSQEHFAIDTMHHTSPSQCRLSQEGAAILDDAHHSTLSVQVKSQEQAAVYFPLIPSAVGAINIEVSARSTLSADAVRRQLVVEVSVTLCIILVQFSSSFS